MYNTHSIEAFMMWDEDGSKSFTSHDDSRISEENSTLYFLVTCTA